MWLNDFTIKVNEPLNKSIAYQSIAGENKYDVTWHLRLVFLEISLKTLKMQIVEQGAIEQGADLRKNIFNHVPWCSAFRKTEG